MEPIEITWDEMMPKITDPTKQIRVEKGYHKWITVFYDQTGTNRSYFYSAYEGTPEYTYLHDNNISTRIL